MASEADIIIVRDNLGPDSLAEDWSDFKIGLLLDSGMSTTAVIRQYWNFRAASTAAFVNISESGSSRSLSDVHKQALDMLKYWDARLAEENAPETPVTSDGRIAFHRSTRV